MTEQTRFVSLIEPPSGWRLREVADPELRRKLDPRLPDRLQAAALLQRLVLHPGRPDVEVVTDPVRGITAAGVATDAGAHREHDLDVIIYGTGFAATEFLAPMTLTGARATAGRRVGRRRARLPRRHRAPVPQPLHRLRAQHQPRRWLHRLDDRGADRLHRPGGAVPGATASATSSRCGAGLGPLRPRGAGPACSSGVGRGLRQLVPERQRPDHHQLGRHGGGVPRGPARRSTSPTTVEPEPGRAPVPPRHLTLVESQEPRSDSILVGRHGVTSREGAP